MQELFISISGLIGAGKTTLASALAKELGVPVHYEKVADNVYLSDFYADMSRYAFPLQIYLLNHRFSQHQQIIWAKKGAVQDRSIYEDAIFAKMLYESGHMDQRDYNTYKTLFDNMSNFMRRPSLIIHLDVTPQQSLDRIKARARSNEQSISLEYLTALHRGYEDFLSEISKSIPVIRVPYQEFASGEKMADIVLREWKRLHMITTVEMN